MVEWEDFFFFQLFYLFRCAITFFSERPVHKALLSQFLAVHLVVRIKPCFQDVNAGHNSQPQVSAHLSLHAEPHTTLPTPPRWLQPGSLNRARVQVGGGTMGLGTKPKHHFIIILSASLLISEEFSWHRFMAKL